MDMHSREQYLERVREEYRNAGKKTKTRVLHEPRKRDAAESESTDRQAGPPSRHRQEEETRATQAGLHQRGTGGIDQSLGVVRLPLWAASGAGAATRSRAAA